MAMANGELVERLSERWVGREAQCKSLAAALGDEQSNSPAQSILVTGPQCTGKTGLVHDVLSSTNVRYASVSALEHGGSVPAVLQALSAKLLESPPFRCASLAGFAASMDEWEVPREERAYLVVDDAQVLVGDRMPPGNSEQGVAPLLRLADHCRRNVGIVLIARSAWPAQLTDLIGDGSPMPLLAEVFFPQYTLKELHSIEARAVPCGHNRKRLHNSFLKTMLGTFAPHTGNLDELRGALDPLWGIYELYDDEEGGNCDAKGAYAYLEQWCGLKSTPGGSRKQEARPLDASACLPLSSAALGLRRKSDEPATPPAAERLDFELPFHAKLVLLAAFRTGNRAKGGKAGSDGDPPRKPFSIEALEKGYRRLCQACLGRNDANMELARQCSIQEHVSQLIDMGLLHTVGHGSLGAPKLVCSVGGEAAERLQRALGEATPSDNADDASDACEIV